MLAIQGRVPYDTFQTSQTFPDRNSKNPWGTNSYGRYHFFIFFHVSSNTSIRIYHFSPASHASCNLALKSWSSKLPKGFFTDSKRQHDKAVGEFPPITTYIPEKTNLSYQNMPFSLSHFLDNIKMSSCWNKTDTEVDVPFSNQSMRIEVKGQLSYLLISESSNPVPVDG